VGFYDISGFPYVITTMDYTHIIFHITECCCFSPLEMASVFRSTNSAMVMLWYPLLNIASCPNSSLEKLFGLIPTLMLV